MKTRLNVSTNPQENKKPFLAGAVLTGAVGLIALVVLAHTSWKAWQSSRKVRHDISVSESEIRAASERRAKLEADFQAPEAQRLFDRADFLNSMIGERSFPWTKIFVDLEETLPAGTRVVEISPRLINGRAEVELRVSAANEEAMIQLLKSVESSKVFSGMTVQREQVARDQDSFDRIEVDLTVWYSTT